MGNAWVDFFYWGTKTDPNGDIYTNNGSLCFAPEHISKFVIDYDGHFTNPNQKYPKVENFYPSATGIVNGPSTNYMIGYCNPSLLGWSYSTNRLVCLRDVAFATYKKIKVVVANKRSSGVLKVDSLKFCLLDSSGNLIANTAVTLRSSTTSVNNGSTSTYYANIPIVPNWYNNAYYVGVYIGEFSAKRKVYVGVDNETSRYAGDAKSGYFRSNVLYSDFIANHSTLYVACGDNGSGYKSTAYGVYFKQFVNIMGDDTFGNKALPIDSSPTLAIPTNFY